MSELSSFVWGIADVLRGPYKPNQYGNVILPFTILRRLECVMEPHRTAMVEVLVSEANEVARRAKLRQRTRTDDWPGLTFWNSSKYTLAKALEDPDNLAANLIDYVNGFSADIDVFKSFGFDAQIAELDRYDRLGLVTRAFAGIDLHPDTVDNAAMGDLFENLIYRFAEASNEQAGDFYTPRDAVRLLVDLVFAEDTEALRTPGVVRAVYDPTAGTGGMLSVADEHLRAMNPGARLSLFAQEINASSYAICKSDLLIKGQDVTQVRQGDTLADDKFADRHFDFILSNPPFGQDWKASEKAVRRDAEHGGRFSPGLPAIGDGAMLFLLHVASKMRPVDEFGRGGRAGIVLNGSPLFNGGAGSGPSDIRGWLLENDLVDAIIGLPRDMFYNTGIATYLWILDNSKAPERVGKVQLIDATGFATKMRKSLGNKRVEISEADRTKIVQAYADFTESDISKVFENLDFAYWAVSVERPLRLNFACTPERIERVAEVKAIGRVDGLIDALRSFGDRVYVNRTDFRLDLGRTLGSRRVMLTTPQWKTLLSALGERDENADICVDAKGCPEPDPGLRDTETIPFGWSGHPKAHDARDETVAHYFETEIRPFAPNAWIDDARTRIGYEIPFSYLFLAAHQAYDIETEEREFLRLERLASHLAREVREFVEHFALQARAEGWPTVRLRRVATVRNGGTPDADEENWGGGLWWATPVDVNASDGLLLGTDRTLTTKGRGSSKPLPVGAVLISSRAPIGNVTITGVETLFNQGCKGLVCGPQITPECLAFQMMALKGVLEALGQGTTFNEISADRLGDVSVVVPPPEVQEILDFRGCIANFHAARHAFEDLTELSRSRRRGTYRVMQMPLDRYGEWTNADGSAR